MRFFDVAKKRRNAIRSLVIGICLCALVAGVAILDNDENVYARSSDGFHVVIDAGHGGKDKGASSSNGTYESDINLKIAKYLGNEFKSRGVGVTYTRTDHNSLASILAGNKKLDDMRNRQKIIEKVAPDLVISIHLNNFIADRTVRGLQCFYPRRSEPSKQFAEAVQAEFNETQQHINRTAKIGDFYILDCTIYPSILVECGFLSNAAEEKLLKTSEYQKVIAYHIAAAVLGAQA